MKKIILSAFLFCLTFLNAYADKQTTVLIPDETEDSSAVFGKKRTTFFAPPVTLHIDGHRFSWGSQFSFCGIELLAEDGAVVFSQPLNGMESSVSIPETLSGTLTIVMYLNDIVYTGEITI